ncbi:MAG TPA: FG-GAP-like repeat-containing protein [Ignavibacteriaceae bacterium]|nr:FG-GAP-like repeat-containing protein [Ignavibacteriaceae bacterium]
MKKSYFFPITLFLLTIGSISNNIYPQQLVQSFIELNIVGNSRFGYSVSGAGDVNNDGFGDVIVGATDYNLLTGRAYIIYGGISMDNQADVILTGEKRKSFFGCSVSGAGDVNNDGFDDVIIGAYGYDSLTGRAYIYYGGSSMDNTADVTMTGEEIWNYYGNSVSYAGDVNNDGFDDVIVGAYGYYFNTGKAYIYYGGNSMDNQADVTLTGENSGNYFGCSVADAGDVNNDGFDDVIVGEYRYNSFTGRANIYYGGSTMNDTVDIRMNGEETNNNFGWSVSGAGDVNNDGFDDVIVGAHRFNSSTGKAYIYFGGNSMDNLTDVTLTGKEIYNMFGRSVSGVGDVNNDGFDDVIVGAIGYDSSRGGAFIYYGGRSMDSLVDIAYSIEVPSYHFGFSVSGAGDLNSDGFDDVIVGDYVYCRTLIYYGGNNMNNTTDVTLRGEGTSNNFGYSVSEAGDVNNDGFDDLIVGAYGYNFYSGRAYIYYGGSSMDNKADITFTGEYKFNTFGTSVSGAGDVNNDGFDDVIVGATEDNNSSTGKAYIFFGGNNMDNSADVTMIGEGVSDYFGCSVSGLGDVNKDGFDDVIVGAYGYNFNTGRAYIYYGGSSMNNTADFTLNGENKYNYYGISVSGAGDLNNDGYNDVIVGAEGYNSYTGKTYIYYGGSRIYSTPDIIMNGENSDNKFGRSVSGAGDVNNDGFDDVIVGAYGYNSSSGKAYIYYGGINMNNTADVTMAGEGTDNWLGFSVSGAGDVNNDGIDDVIVGAYGYYTQTGRVYIYYGGNIMDNLADVTLTGEETSNYFGFSVSGAGDVNNDGFDDVIMGAYGFPVNGKVYIYSNNSAPSNIELTTFPPADYVLFQNYPNPFNPNTTIKFGLPKDSKVVLEVYNTMGEKVTTLIDQEMSSGYHNINFTGNELSTGIYIYKITANEFTSTKKFVLMK